MAFMPPPQVVGPQPDFGVPPDPQKVKENQKRDERRKQGAAALRAVKSAPAPSGGLPPPVPNAPAPAPPQVNSTADAPPQMHSPTAPVPQYTAPSFTPAQYEPPKKGLEYLAMGIGLLFPGAPIASAASSFARSLTQNANDKYKRNEHDAEQQYKVAQDAASGAFQNDQAKYGASKDAAAVDFQNSKLTNEAQQAQRAQGIDPKTGKPFILPPELQRVLPPGANRPVTNNDLASHEAALANFYTRVGASDQAKEHSARAAEYHKQVIDDANNARALQIAMYNQQQQNLRENSREINAMRLEGAREGAADARESRREAHSEYMMSVREARADARATLNDGNKRETLKGESLRASKEFYGEWAKAIKQPLGADGTPKKGADGKEIPALIAPQMAALLTKTFSAIDSDTDPARAAQYHADHIAGDSPSGAVQKQLILDRGRAAELNRRSLGKPILPHAFHPVVDPKSDAVHVPAGTPDGEYDTPQYGHIKVVNGVGERIKAAHTAPSHVAPPSLQDSLQPSM